MLDVDGEGAMRDNHHKIVPQETKMKSNFIINEMVQKFRYNQHEGKGELLGILDVAGTGGSLVPER